VERGECAQDSQGEAMSDEAVYFALQGALIAVAAFLASLDMLARWRAGTGSLSMEVRRSVDSVMVFIAAFAALDALFVAFAVSAEFIQWRTRVACATLDTLLIWYICLMNGWARNKFAGMMNWLRVREKR
jgi:hypothetical protein